MEGTVKQVREAVENYFETDDLKYDPFDEDDVARTGFAVKTKFGHVDVLFHAYDSHLIIHTIIPIKAQEEDRAKVGEFLLRANYGLRNGCFDFDYDTGRISYRTALFCGIDDFTPPTYEQIDYSMLISLSMVKKYGNALMKVIFGLVEPEDAIEEVEDSD